MPAKIDPTDRGVNAPERNNYESTRHAQIRREHEQPGFLDPVAYSLPPIRAEKIGMEVNSAEPRGWKK